MLHAAVVLYLALKPNAMFNLSYYSKILSSECLPDEFEGGFGNFEDRKCVRSCHLLDLLHHLKLKALKSAKTISIMWITSQLDILAPDFLSCGNWTDTFILQRENLSTLMKYTR